MQDGDEHMKLHSNSFKNLDCSRLFRIGGPNAIIFAIEMYMFAFHAVHVIDAFF